MWASASTCTPLAHRSTARPLDRSTARLLEPRFPVLEMFYWNRIVFDEARSNRFKLSSSLLKKNK